MTRDFVSINKEQMYRGKLDGIQRYYLYSLGLSDTSLFLVTRALQVYSRAVKYSLQIIKNDNHKCISSPL